MTINKILLVVGLILGLTTTVAVAGSLNCVSTSVRLGRPDLPKKPIGFAYNSFVITTIGDAREGLEKAAWNLQREHPTEARKADARLRALNAYIASLEEKRPSRFLSNRMVAHAPMYADLYHVCDSGNFLVMNHQYLLYATEIGGLSGVRVVGDLCSSPAQLTWETAALNGQLSLREIARSHLGRGNAMGDVFVQDTRGQLAQHPLERLVLDILAVSDVQCGRAPERMEMDVRYSQTNGPAALAAYVNGGDVQSIKLRLMHSQEGYVMEIESTPDADKFIAWDAERRSRIENWNAGQSERVALGALMVTMTAAMIGATSPCFDDPANFAC